MRKTAIAIAIAFSLSGCITSNASYAGGGGLFDGLFDNAGTIVGGTGGWYVGSQIGKGRGNVAAQVIGTFIGGAMGRNYDRRGYPRGGHGGNYNNCCAYGGNGNPGVESAYLRGRSEREYDRQRQLEDDAYRDGRGYSGRHRRRAW